jgi:hypothetical protein
MMASDGKKIKTSPAPKNETAPKKNEALPTNKNTPSAELPKAKSGEKTVDSPASYSRGEGQKPVSKAYKDNWNIIFAKKKKR